MNCNKPGFFVLHYLSEFAQTHIHWVGDAIQPYHPLSLPSPALNLSQHQGLFISIPLKNILGKWCSWKKQCGRWVTNILILGPHVMDVLLALGSVEMPQVSIPVKIWVLEPESGCESLPDASVATWPRGVMGSGSLIGLYNMSLISKMPRALSLR